MSRHILSLSPEQLVRGHRVLTHVMFRLAAVGFAAIPGYFVLD